MYRLPLIVFALLSRMGRGRREARITYVTNRRIDRSALDKSVLAELRNGEMVLEQTSFKQNVVLSPQATTVVALEVALWD
ncbi:hypothetical protein HOY82DRAFT_557626 [Tuber indicum]|nr:hypothetical protein HOY82DRAFT_557626 [Tuber indicum]